MTVWACVLKFYHFLSSFIFFSISDETLDINDMRTGSTVVSACAKCVLRLSRSEKYGTIKLHFQPFQYTF